MYQGLIGVEDSRMYSFGEDAVAECRVLERCHRGSCGHPLASVNFSQSAHSGVLRRRHDRVRNISYELGSRAVS